MIALRGVDSPAGAAAAKSLVYGDPQSERLMKEADLVAPTGTTVLLIGETGTGKELVARHIHARSQRSGPFIAVNCGALSSTLVDAELFGHESGAFTGANHARAGWFEEANGGTLFLDEIGDLPLSLQVKLLRVLQERQVVRIGARQPVAIDVRLVAATHVDLAGAVQEGRFRADLFYRLHVAALHIAPLRERPGDIRPLAQYFLDSYRSKFSRRPQTLSAAAEQALLNYPWPGNIRELENVIQFAMIVAQGQLIEREHLRLPDATLTRGSVDQPLDSISTIRAAVQQLLERGQPSLDRALEEAITRTVLEWCKGNQVRAAKALGISRNVLRARLKRGGLLGNRLIIPME